MRALSRSTTKMRNKRQLVNCGNAIRLHGLRALVLAGMFSGIAWGPAAINGSVYASAQTSQRSVQGRVVNADNVPIPNAIVYLSNTRTKSVSSYITHADGAYRFEQISPHDDYRLWARLDDDKSKIKTLSSFDGRSVFHVILKIENKK